ncbi:hypothetical protein AGLY_005513 [Aphis glycines]|uniref:Uncharacterized protein n=1 Tax=Aphis glycines TaxID=307491 RepID=A0A6G0TUC4_APHGL|nr:hypothetical protein AGLY_005513 [Aphis glycines]
MSSTITIDSSSILKTHSEYLKSKSCRIFANYFIVQDSYFINFLDKEEENEHILSLYSTSPLLAPERSMNVITFNITIVLFCASAIRCKCVYLKNGFTLNVSTKLTIKGYKSSKPIDICQDFNIYNRDQCTLYMLEFEILYNSEIKTNKNKRESFPVNDGGTLHICLWYKYRLIGRSGNPLGEKYAVNAVNITTEP